MTDPATPADPDSSSGRAGASPPDRTSLPVSAADLPPPGPDYEAALDDGLRWLGLELAPGRRAAMADQVRLLLAWGRAINLTAIRQPEAVAREHVVDSLSAVPLLRRLAPPRPTLLDLGSGAGYPGLPLGLALEASRLALVESIVKKARFLEVAAAAAARALEANALDPLATDVLAARAESLAQQPDQAASWDVVTVRAVASLADLAGLALPFLRPGGLLVAWKREREASEGRPALAVELAAARLALADAGASLEAVEPVTVPGLEDHRLVVVRAGASPARRRPAAKGSRRAAHGPGGRPIRGLGHRLP